MEKTLKVDGMTCGGCENRVQTAVGRVEGVVRANADHRNGALDVRFDEARVSEEQIKDRIRAVGYAVA
jgi:copper chaperone